MWVDFCFFGDRSGIGDWPWGYWPPEIAFRTSFEQSIGDRWPNWVNDREYSVNGTGYTSFISPLCRATDLANNADGLD
jgi:hypothetical protein